MDGEMNIVIACSKEYAKYAMVMLDSLFENNADHFIHLYVMLGDALDEEKNKIEFLTRKFNNSVRFIQLPFNSREREVKEFWPSINTIDRWQAINLLPENVEKFLMLDIDILVKGDLWELYSIDFEDKYIVVCKDLALATYYDSDAEWIVALRKYQTENLIEKYGNFGVVLVKRSIRNFFDYNIMLDTIIKNKYLTVDQDYFNLNMGEYIKFIEPYEYNYLIGAGYREQIVDKAKVVHYAGRLKPWKTQTDGPREKMWIKYAERTPGCEDIVIECERKWKNEWFSSWENCNRYCELMHTWMFIRAVGGTVFDKYDFSAIALYGAGRMCRHLLADWKQTEITCKGIYDKNETLNQVENINLYHNLETYLEEISTVDAIIVTAISFFDEITNKLKKKTAIKIISLEEMIQECGRGFK